MARARYLIGFAVLFWGSSPAMANLVPDAQVNKLPDLTFASISVSGKTTVGQTFPVSASKLPQARFSLGAGTPDTVYAGSALTCKYDLKLQVLNAGPGPITNESFSLGTAVTFPSGTNAANLGYPKCPLGESGSVCELSDEVILAVGETKVRFSLASYHGYAEYTKSNNDLEVTLSVNPNCEASGSGMALQNSSRSTMQAAPVGSGVKQDAVAISRASLDRAFKFEKVGMPVAQPASKIKPRPAYQIERR